MPHCYPGLRDDAALSLMDTLVEKPRLDGDTGYDTKKSKEKRFPANFQVLNPNLAECRSPCRVLQSDLVDTEAGRANMHRPSL